MKVLYFVPKRYSLYWSFMDIFRSMDAEVYPIELMDIARKWEIFTHSQAFRAPNRWRLKWEKYYFPRVNAYYLATFQRVRPDVVFVYNHELLLPETVEHFKAKGAKVAFFLGDSPFFTEMTRYFLTLLFSADAIFLPDSFWAHQLSKIGLKNLHLFRTAISSREYFEKELSPEEYEALRSEVLYVGMCYINSWGYKKARFLNQFIDFDLKIHGNRHWRKWFSFFPGLADHFSESSGYIPVETMNSLFNATRIMPVDGNPGILHGPHLRIWEALGAGVLPLMEWQNDFDEIFGAGADIPAVRSYDEAREMAAYYLANEEARREKVAWMKKVITEKYSLERQVALLKQALALA